MKDKKEYSTPTLEIVKIDLNPLLVMSPGADNEPPGAPEFYWDEE